MARESCGILECSVKGKKRKRKKMHDGETVALLPFKEGQKYKIMAEATFYKNQPNFLPILGRKHLNPATFFFPPPPNQTTAKNVISSLFSPKFSILLKISPNKHTLNKGNCYSAIVPTIMARATQNNLHSPPPSSFPFVFSLCFQMH